MVNFDKRLYNYFTKLKGVVKNMTNEREIFAQNLKAYREVHHLNQYEFAEDCGISRDTLSLIECQRENFTIDTLQLFAAKIGCSAADLLSPSPIRYHLTTVKKTIEDENSVCYGIAAVKNKTVINSVEDISDDYNKVLSLLRFCDDNKLDPEYLMTVCTYFVDAEG